MKKIKTTLIGLAIIPFLLVSCKYEEGPAVSLRSKKARVANTWKISEATENGEDVTENYDQYELWLSEDGDARLDATYAGTTLTFVYKTDGTWQFLNSKENLEIDMENNNADQVYQILRLKEEELWLRAKGEEVELHLIPK